MDFRRAALVVLAVERVLADPEAVRVGCHLEIDYDVAEVLEHDDVFQVPFGEKVRRLNGGPNFLLGMQRDSEYWVCQKQVMQAFRRDDVAKIVAPLAERASNDIIAQSEGAGKGRIDAIEGLITRVPIVIFSCNTTELKDSGAAAS